MKPTPPMDPLAPISRLAYDIAFDSRHSIWLSPLFLIFDGILTGAVVNRIPYTEIDWVAYMQQIALYRSGERDYANIKGQTGPLVYPAGHVAIYDALYRLTDGGSDIFRAQCIFTLVYLGALGTVMACYRQAKVPPYLLALLILSKRLHSIFVLRLFNDGFAVLGLFSAIYFYQSDNFTLGSLAFSFALSIKMSILLAAPGVGIVLLQALPSKRVINMGMLMAQVQVLLATPFLIINPRAYVSRAFQFTRQFLFKWTVNWRFVGEDTFLSQTFAINLLLAHLLLLALFLVTRWTRPSGMSPYELLQTFFNPLPPKMQLQLSRNVTPDFVMTTILTSLVTGLLCARSLHYQFYAYIAWSTPFLLWKSGMPAYLTVIVWGAQEWAWNVYPSTNLSSALVVACLSIQVFGAWFGTRNDFLRPRTSAASSDKNVLHGPVAGI